MSKAGGESQVAGPKSQVGTGGLWGGVKTRAPCLGGSLGKVSPPDDLDEGATLRSVGRSQIFRYGERPELEFRGDFCRTEAGTTLGGGLVEVEGGVDDAGGVFDLHFVDGDGDFDLGGGDHADVDASGAEGGEHLGGDSGVGAHADADHGEFADAGFGFDLGGGAEVGEDGFEGGLGTTEVVGVHREAVAGEAVVRDVGDNHVDVDLRFGECSEDACRHAGFIGDADDGDAGLGAFD